MDAGLHRNIVHLCGTLGGRPRFSHWARTVEYYIFPLVVTRSSGAEDQLNILVSREMLSQIPLTDAPKIAVSGELRSFNNRTGSGSRLILSVFARTMDLVHEHEENEISLRGVICKPPILRKTPLGREICDLCLAVRRRYGRADYLTLIAWGQTAAHVATMPVGAVLDVKGRVQSRGYTKVEGEKKTERVAFEVSVRTVNGT